MRVLGIETSCDETSVAIVSDDKEILVNLVHSQIEEHEPFMGVVPEIAARAHLTYLDQLLPKALSEAKLDWKDIDGIAVTGGPGLIGGVIVGVMAAKSIASVHQLPFIAVNHLEGHVLTPRLSDKVLFPYLVLLVSGGHSQILIAKGLDNYQRLGTTLDDAVGEAFDKSAKILGLGYPGGPQVEKMAKQAKDPMRFKLPRPMIHKANQDSEEMNFSFSGLKTAVKCHADALLENGQLKSQDVADLCAGLQIAIGDVLENRIEKAIEIYLKQEKPSNPSLVICGGVAANQYLRDRLTVLTDRYGVEFKAPPMKLCSDNAAMIAWAGLEHLKKGDRSDLSFKPRPRWPLDKEANSAIGSSKSKSGVKV